MAQLLPRTPSLGSMLVQGLGGGVSAGISSGLDMLLKAKMQQLIKEQEARHIEPLYDKLGINKAIAHEDPQVRAQAIKTALQEQNLRKIQESLLGRSLEGQYRVTPETPTEISEEGTAQSQPIEAPQATEMKALSKFTPAEEELILSARDPRQLHETILDIYKTREKTEIDRRAETRKYREKMLDRWEDLKKEEMRLRKMQKLSETGKLNNPLMVKLLDKLDLKFLLSPESAEYEKTAADLLRRIITGTKGRVSEMIVREFIKSLPNLVINPEGRKRIENALLALNQIEQLYPKTMVNLLNQYKGRPHPVDLQVMVAEKVSSNLEPYIKKMEEALVATKKPSVSLPPAERYKEGDALRNKQTGKIEYINTAGNWKKV
jgi:hypothetical protein